MSYEYFIAKRYLRSKKRTGLISFTTFFSFIVILLGVACLTTILSILNGFESVVLDRFLAFDSHVKVMSKGEEQFPDAEQFTTTLKNIPQITGYSPYISAKAMLTSDYGEFITTLKGVDLETVDRVSRFRDKVIYGTNDFTIDTVKTEFGIILGKATADKLLVTPGDEIRVMSLRGLSRVYQIPPVRKFTVTGIFDAEIIEYNLLYSFVPLSAMQRFLRMGNDVTGFDINTTHIENSTSVAQSLREVVPENLLVKTWFDLHKNLFASMKLEKWAALVVLSLMILVASFSIASSLIMLVLEKRKEIGILKSMGSSANGIKRIFIMNGMIIGSAGTILGLLIGLGFCLIQLKYELILLPTDIYIIELLPVKINPLDFILVGIIALILTFAATLYPARSAAKLIPARALKYE